MKDIFTKWWDKSTKCFAITNFKELFKALGLKPRISFSCDNGANSLEVYLTVGYITFSYIKLQNMCKKQNVYPVQKESGGEK